MNKIKNYWLTLGLIATNICAADPTALINKAETIRLKAAEVGFEWTTTSKLIAEARQAAKEGNKELSEKLASEAIKQAEASLKQAKFAAANWQSSEPD